MFPLTPPDIGTKPLVLFSTTFAVYNTDLLPQVNLGTNDLLLLDVNKASKCLRTYLVFAISKSLSRCASRRFTAQTNVFVHKVSKNECQDIPDLSRPPWAGQGTGQALIDESLKKDYLAGVTDATIPQNESGNNVR